MLSQSSDLIHEQVYLVARGVRAAAIVGGCEPESDLVHEIATELGIAADCEVVTFILPERGGAMLYGFAWNGWVVELLQWAFTECPDLHAHLIIGLLLGYSPAEICRFEERRQWSEFSWSV